MYQETNGGNATKKQDLLLFFGLLALVILARMLMNAVSSIPHGSILQIPFCKRSGNAFVNVAPDQLPIRVVL